MNEIEKQMVIVSDIDKTKLDYTKYQNYIEFLKEYDELTFGYGLTFIYDFSKHCFIYISSGSEAMPKRKFAHIENKGYKCISQNIHPADVEHFIKVEKSVIEFLSAKSKTEILDYKLTFKLRILRKSGNFVPHYIQSKIIQTDYDGNIWLALGKCIQSTCECNDFPLIVKNRKKRQILMFTPNNVNSPIFMQELTKREYDVLKLLKDNKTTNEIADMLNISSHTVKKHKTSIYSKLFANDQISLKEHSKLLGY